MTPDMQLISRCFAGDESAWRELVSRYQALIYTLACERLEDTSAAADVFLDVCLELYYQLEAIADANDLRARLIAITRRKCEQSRSHRPHAATLDKGVVEHDLEQRFRLDLALQRLAPAPRRMIASRYPRSERRSPVAHVQPAPTVQEAEAVERLLEHWVSQA